MRGFRSFEEMLEAVSEDMQAANAVTDDMQASLEIGDFFIREAHGFFIYGEVLDPITTENPEERAYEIERRNQPHMKHFRFTRCFSPMCPHGELGDVHVSTVTLKSASMFERCQEAKWPQNRDELMMILGVS